MNTVGRAGLGLALAILLSGTAAAQSALAMRGQTLFGQCRACHAVKAGAPNGLGPNLFGVAGALAGTRPGFAYSAALKASGVRWTDARLDAWLIAPSAVVKGNKMAFAGLPKPDDRAAIIAFLKTAR